MDAIKKKMQCMKVEKDNAMDKADACDLAARDAKARAEKAQEEADDLTKKIQQLEIELDQYTEKLMTVTLSMEEKQRAVAGAELEVNALNRRIQGLEDELETYEEKYVISSQKLDKSSSSADESDRLRKVLENRCKEDDEKMVSLENQLKETRSSAEEADKKCDIIAKELSQVENTLEVVDDRADNGETKILEFEEELKVVANNLKSLEVSEQKANQREESYKEQIRDLTNKLKHADKRSEFAEKTVEKLQKEVLPIWMVIQCVFILLLLCMGTVYKVGRFQAKIQKKVASFKTETRISYNTLKDHAPGFLYVIVFIWQVAGTALLIKGYMKSKENSTSEVTCPSSVFMSGCIMILQTWVIAIATILAMAQESFRTYKKRQSYTQLEQDDITTSTKL